MYKIYDLVINDKLQEKVCRINIKKDKNMFKISFSSLRFIELKTSKKCYKKNIQDNINKMLEDYINTIESSDDVFVKLELDGYTN